jgi:hypothetical protein
MRAFDKVFKLLGVAASLETGPKDTKAFVISAGEELRKVMHSLPDPASGNAPEPFAWLVLSEETGNTRLWSRNGDIAKTFAAKHGLECISLYRAVPASANAQEAVLRKSETQEGFNLIINDKVNAVTSTERPDCLLKHSPACALSHTDGTKP